MRVSSGEGGWHGHHQLLGGGQPIGWRSIHASRPPLPSLTNHPPRRRHAQPRRRIRRAAQSADLARPVPSPRRAHSCARQPALAVCGPPRRGPTGPPRRHESRGTERREGRALRRPSPSRCSSRHHLEPDSMSPAGGRSAARRALPVDRGDLVVSHLDPQTPSFRDGPTSCSSCPRTET